MYNDYKKAIGKVISNIEMDDHTLRIDLEDGSRLVFRDEGQSCCEHRYMTCDDNFSSCIGERFDGFNLSDVERAEANCEDNVHQVTFLEITTHRDHFKVVNHNEHNGYYDDINEAQDVVKAFNARNNSPTVPDWYMIAELQVLK